MYIRPGSRHRAISAPQGTLMLLFHTHISSLLPHFPQLRAQVTTNLFFISITLSFSECPLHGIILSPFGFGFFYSLGSPEICSFRLLHVATVCSFSFLSSSPWYRCAVVFRVKIIHPWKDI